MFAATSSHMCWVWSCAEEWTTFTSTHEEMPWSWWAHLSLWSLSSFIQGIGCAGRGKVGVGWGNKARILHILGLSLRALHSTTHITFAFYNHSWDLQGVQWPQTQVLPDRYNLGLTSRGNVLPAPRYALKMLMCKRLITRLILGP